MQLSSPFGTVVATRACSVSHRPLFFGSALTLALLTTFAAPGLAAEGDESVLFEEIPSVAAASRYA